MKVFATCAFILGLGFAGSAYAHHSMSGFERTKTVTLTGTIKQFKWANPHCWMEMEVANSKGGSDIWNFEMNPPAYLVRSGWKSTSVKVGDKVKVTGRPFMNGDPGGIFVSLTLENGQVLGAGAQPSQITPTTAGQPAQPPQR